jgi:hypothetical protein
VEALGELSVRVGDLVGMASLGTPRAACGSIRGPIVHGAASAAGKRARWTT